MARHAKYPRRPRRVASERLYTGGTRSVASALERRCSACADLAKTDVATTPGIPGYATIGLCQGAGICAAPRGREVALLRDRMPTNMARHAKYPRRPRRVALWGVSHRSGSWRRRNGRGASFPAIGVSILPEKKRRGAGTDGTDTACGGHRWHRSCPSVRGGPSIGVHLCRRSRSRHSLPHFKMRFQCVINPIANQAP